MKNSQLDQFLKGLLRGFQVYAPVKNGQELYISPISDIGKIDWSGRMPYHPWKNIFYPVSEKLFKYEKNDQPEKPVAVPERRVCFGMNILDLRALVLFDQVFEKDIYYQKRRQNILVIGYFNGAPENYRQYKIFAHEFEERDLEHLGFDVFLEKSRGNALKFFSGTKRGQKILEEYGIKNYEHIEFAGSVPEEGPDKRLLDLKSRLEKGRGSKVWRDLDKLCLACGKCAINCPTCFCFNNNDVISEEGKKKERLWTTCFYHDFSRIAGRDSEGHHFLNSIADKIYYWYEHKFVRIPHEFSLSGCVGCGRCVRVCPVGIDIKEVLKRL